MSIRDQIIDFRSDTFTKPTQGMRKAMSEAEVGDDVFGEDPTVARLENTIAGLFNRQASLLVPSGTMANLIAMAVHCSRGDEVILERRTHSFSYETGGGAALLGILFQAIDNPEGVLNPEQVNAVIRPKNIHQPISRLVVIENTVNIAGGIIVDIEKIHTFSDLCKENRLKLHMDGARIWHASVATGTSLSDYAARVDTLSCCLSKGLGCPVGSMLVGDADTIEKARWYRKMLGGAMRQAGIIAACGLYALEHHIERLASDHESACRLADGLDSLLGDRFEIQAPETNMVLVHTPANNSPPIIANWKKIGVLALPISDTCIRLVTHMDTPIETVEETLRRIEESC